MGLREADWVEDAGGGSGVLGGGLGVPRGVVDGGWEAVEAVESGPSGGRGRESARGLQKVRKAGRKVGSDRTDEFSFQ